jgi:hypothetical protein
MEKGQPLQQIVLGKYGVHMRMNEIRLYLSPYTEINSMD